MEKISIESRTVLASGVSRDLIKRRRTSIEYESLQVRAFRDEVRPKHSGCPIDAISAR
jgi:hypothetical protein